MKVSRAELRSSVRALFGAWAGDRPAPLPPLPADLPARVVPIVQDAVAALAHYQGVDHARLYLHRLRRFIGRGHVDDDLFAVIARLMADRMTHQDPVRLAQIVLDDAARGVSPARNCVFRLDELVEPLPALIARPLLGLLKWANWSAHTMTRRYSAASAAGRSRLRIESGLRAWRGLGSAYERERVWVERWLHMIDRSLTMQPAAVSAVAATATMMQGYGNGYRRALGDWHLIVDGLIKPACDGGLAIGDLATAIATARAAAGGPDPDALTRTIGAIRAAAAHHDV